MKTVFERSAGGIVLTADGRSYPTERRVVRKAPAG